MIEGIRSRLRDRRAVQLATAALVVVFVGLVVMVSPRPGPGPDGSFPLGTRGPGASEEEWASLTLPPYEPIAELAVDRTDGRDIAADAGFVLHSLTTTPAVALASGVTADPAVDFEVVAGASADLAILRPASPLAAGTQYRLRLDAVDGSLAGTWVFRVAGPLHVTGLLPDDRTTQVPVDSGIEVTFDQDGPTDFESHFSISPEVAGRFELHDRTWVFIPQSPLAPGTMYTYTVSPGVGMADSSQTLETGATASFETAAPSVRESYVGFDRTLYEVRPGTRPLLGVYVSEAEGEPRPDSLPTELYRLRTVEAAASAANTLSNRSDWLEAAEVGLVDTTGLTRSATFDARLTNRTNEYYILRIPAVLNPGFYLIVVPRDGRDVQAVIQVTDLATYALTSPTRTVVWLNDLATGKPVADASVRLAGGPSLGRTDARGILDAATPPALASPTERYSYETAHALAITAADGREVVAAIGSPSGGHYPVNDTYGYYEPAPWWSVLSTDRTAYRTTDTIHVWGLVRDRADRSVPESLVLELGRSDSDLWTPISRTPVEPRPRGTFVADLALGDVPTGGYELRLFVGRQRVASRWLEVAVIRKPAFTLDVTTDHHVYLAGDTIEVTASARFFDGTRAPGLGLNMQVFDYGRDRPTRETVSTDAVGVAVTHLPATADGPIYWTDSTVSAVPSHPEEGEIHGEAPVFVFPSSIWLTARGVVRDGRLHMSGTVSKVALARLDEQVDRTGRPRNPAGAPIGGQTVQIAIVHFVPVRRLVGREYDFIEKRSYPVYVYDERKEVMGTFAVTSTDDGRFSFSLPVPNAKDTYRATLTARDPKHRTSREIVYATRPYPLPPSSGSYLRLDAPERAALDERVTVTVRDQDGKVPDGPFLFIVGRAGIRDVVVSDVGRLERTFGERELPGFTVRAVRLTAAGLQQVGGRYYWDGDARVQLDIADKRLNVTLTPDRARYAPGDTVNIAIRTTGPDGQAIAADVVVRATDQKLYAIDLAEDPDTVADLMAFVDSGFLQTYVAQFVPRQFRDEGGFGGAGGGGGRSDFRDSVTFQLVSTDASGRGRVSFDLSDDLTSWHVSASAFSARLDAGDGFAVIPVGLPFFVEATMAPDYLVGEQPILRLRAYGDGLRARDPVRFVVTAPSLGIAGMAVEGRAFEAVRVTLPALAAGDHAIAIDAVGTGAAGLHDRLTRVVHVVPNRLTMLRTTYSDLTGSLTPPTGSGLTTYLVTDAGRGGLVPVLDSLAEGGGARFDRLAAAEAARSILATTFEIRLDDLASTGFDAQRYQRNLIGLLPYASGDLSLSAKAALVVPELIRSRSLLSTLREMTAVGYDDPHELTRERAFIAYAARAALGDDVLDELRAAPTEGLAVRERLWLAIGFLASGDEATAREIERDVLATKGRQLGPWVRVDAGLASEEATGLMLLLAGGLGDPVASRISRYLTDHPSTERLFVLEQLGYVKAMLDRLPRVAGSFAWIVDGERHVKTLEPGRSFSITLTPAQQQTLSFERLDGALLVTTTAITKAEPADLPSDPGVSITRTVSPAGTAGEDQIVHVTIRVALGRVEGDGCYTVTELVPSGLAPIASTAVWRDEREPSEQRPYLVDGQRVAWCFRPEDGKPLGYSARVVSPGTYVWEPAVVQYDVVPTVGAATSTSSYTIR